MQKVLPGGVCISGRRIDSPVSSDTPAAATNLQAVEKEQVNPLNPRIKS